MNHMSKMNRFRDIKLFPFTLSTGAHLPCEARHALRARLASLGFARNKDQLCHVKTKLISEFVSPPHIYYTCNYCERSRAKRGELAEHSSLRKASELL